MDKMTRPNMSVIRGSTVFHEKMGKIHAIVGAVAQTSCISDDTGHDMQLNVHVHVCGVLTTLQNQFCYFNKTCLCTEFHPIYSCIYSAEINIVIEQWYLTDFVSLHM